MTPLRELAPRLFALAACALVLACGPSRPARDEPDTTTDTDAGSTTGTGRVVKTCNPFGEADCPQGYACVSGLCATTSEVACVLTTTAEDGCEATSVCKNAGDRGNACFGFPDCPANGICPVGTEGAMCNEGAFAGKGRVCVSGACTGDQHCPTGRHCVLRQPGDTVGTCASTFTGGQHCNGDGTCWVEGGCPVTPGADFSGTGAPGAACDLDNGPRVCKPFCCACSSTGAALVASCDFDRSKCATEADACAAYRNGTGGGCF